MYINLVHVVQNTQRVISFPATIFIWNRKQTFIIFFQPDGQKSLWVHLVSDCGTFDRTLSYPKPKPGFRAVYLNGVWTVWGQPCCLACTQCTTLSWPNSTSKYFGLKHAQCIYTSGFEQVFLLIVVLCHSSPPWLSPRFLMPLPLNRSGTVSRHVTGTQH